MGKGYVVVPDIIEKVDLGPIKEESGCDRVNGRVAPALVEETTSFIKGSKIVEIGS